MMSIGTWEVLRMSAPRRRTSVNVVRDASARSVARWMTGPSAIGSEKGTPTSMMSAPACSRASIRSAVVLRSGSPAVMKGTKALRLLPRSSWNLFSILVMELRCRDPGGVGSTRQGLPRQPHRLIHIFIPAPGQVHHRDLVFSHLQLLRLGHRVRALQRWNNTFKSAEFTESTQRFFIVNRRVFYSPGIVQRCVFRSDRRVIQAC